MINDIKTNTVCGTLAKVSGEPVPDNDVNVEMETLVIYNVIKKEKNEEI